MVVGGWGGCGGGCVVVYIYIHTNSRRLEHRDYLPRLSARQQTSHVWVTAQAHPIHLTVTGAHTLNFNSDISKQSRGDPKAVRQKVLTCGSALQLQSVLRSL